MKSETDNGKIDLWVRQVTLMAVLLVALALIAMGVALYAPHAHAGPSGGRSRSSFVEASSDRNLGGENTAAIEDHP